MVTLKLTHWFYCLIQYTFSSYKAESLKTPVEPEDEAVKLEKENLIVSIQLAENKTLEYDVLNELMVIRVLIIMFSRSKLKHLDKNINSIKAKLNEKTGVLDTVNRAVQNAMQTSTRRINAFSNFLSLYKERLVCDLNQTQELLMELQNKECEKALNKKEVRITIVVYLSAFHTLFLTV